MEEDVWGYPKLDDVLSLSWSNGRRRVRVPHTVANRYGIPAPAMTCHEENAKKRCSRGSWSRGALCLLWACPVARGHIVGTIHGEKRRFLLNHDEAETLENQGKRCNHRCARWDSNPHDRSHRNLNPARLPITPLARIVQNPRRRTPPRALWSHLRCARWDSNPHDRSHRNLNPARLPITPLARIVQNPRRRTPPRALWSHLTESNCRPAHYE